MPLAAKSAGLTPKSAGLTAKSDGLTAKSDGLTAKAGGAPPIVVAQDATSGIYVPGSVAQWAALGVAAPVSIWEMQEPSGDLADTLAAYGLTKTVGSPTYGQAMTGWSRLGLGAPDGSSAQFANSTVPDASTSSLLMLVYAEITATPATIRNLACIGASSTRSSAELNATPRVVANNNGNSATGTNPPSGNVRPYLLKYDLTGTVVSLYTNLEKLTPTWAAGTTGARISIMSSTARLCPPAKYCYGALWTGANAEISDATAKATLQALGWTIPW